MSEVECICTCARARPHFPDLANGRDQIQILCVNRDPLGLFCTCRCGVHLHVRTCTPLGGTERRLIKLPAHEQPTFGPQRYPKSAASQVTEGWLNMRQQLFVRIVVFSMRNQPERSRRGGFSKVAADLGNLRRS